ncbi:hypothetical protein [Sulfitobacter aestuariivivens]|uniref:Thioredoxin family protein n=1 Tax=Sulfitobacter aestuariivivens TaxID=2766981 RepID=A0A927DBC1_9RHOB|nr:hypothetical protein [Sulfitobacter aestuariivivens]MBD3666151.1 hypothetical protein [Sulfitobacter aestuariivivens]
MIKLLAFLFAVAVPTTASADLYLLMAEEDGCIWCERWNDEIAHIYPKTAEGRVAPLQRYDLHGETPDVVFERRVHFTPTFILVDDGRELGRIEGYPGEDFFWGLLSLMFDRANVSLDQKG